jgi:hypothetical protein
MNNYHFLAYDIVDIISPNSKWNGKVGIIYKCYESGLFGVCLIGRLKHHMQYDPPKNMRRFTSHGLRIKLPISVAPSSGQRDPEQGWAAYHATKAYYTRGLELHVQMLESDVQHVVPIAQAGRKEVNMCQNRIRLGLPISDIWDIWDEETGYDADSRFESYQESMEAQCEISREEVLVFNRFYMD